MKERGVKQQLLVIIPVVVLLIVLGWVDYVTGPDFGFSLFYIIPIGFVAWRFGRAEALLAAIVAGFAWILAEAPWKTETLIWSLLWNGFTRFAIYTFIATSVSALRRDKETIDSANQRLRELLEHTEKLARTDALTGLANSRAFQEKLHQEATRSRRNGKGLCLVYMDLDNFKRVNDLHGHTRGDEVLGEVAALLKVAFRETDLVARLGGDEFCALLNDVDPRAAKDIGARIIEAVDRLNDNLEGVQLGASVGIVYFESPPSDLDLIISKADSAMYAAKASGKGRVEVHLL